MTLLAILITLFVAALVALVVKVIGDHLFPQYSGIAAFAAFILVCLARFGVGL